MKQKIKTILLLVLFAAFAMWLYPTVVGYWATLYIPLASKLPRTRMIIGTWLSAGGASGAAICAFLLAWPLGYLSKVKPIIIGAAFGLITAGFPLIVFISTGMEDGFNGFVTSIFAVEQVAFVAASIFSPAGVVVWLIKRRGRPTRKMHLTKKPSGDLPRRWHRNNE